MSLLGALLFSSGAGAHGKGGFCDSGVVHDYEGALKDLPGNEELPRFPPFAPDALETAVLRIGSDRLVYAGEAPAIQLRNTSEAAPLDLGFTIEMRTASISGGAPSVTQTTVEALPPGQSLRIVGAPLDAQGTAQVEIRFVDGQGATLAAYTEYVQVVPFRLDVRLRLTQRSITPGGVLYARLDNLGTREITYGEPFILERFARGGWRQVPGKRLTVPVLHGTKAGYAGGCNRVRVPASAPPGTYRVRKMFHPGAVTKQQRFVSQTFRVRSEG